MEPATTAAVIEGVASVYVRSIVALSTSDRPHRILRLLIRIAPTARDPQGRLCRRQVGIIEQPPHKRRECRASRRYPRP